MKFNQFIMMLAICIMQIMYQDVEASGVKIRPKRNDKFKKIKEAVKILAASLAALNVKNMSEDQIRNWIKKSIAKFENLSPMTRRIVEEVLLAGAYITILEGSWYVTDEVIEFAAKRLSNGGKGKAKGTKVTGDCEEEGRQKAVVEDNTMRNVCIVVGVVVFLVLAVSAAIVIR